VAADAEQDAVRAQVAEMLVAQRGVLVGLGNADGDPVPAVRLEPRPATVPVDLSLAALLRQPEPDLELGRQPPGTGQRDEQAVKVRAVATAALVSPEGVTPAPAHARLVVTHVAVHYVKQGPAQLQRVIRQPTAREQLHRAAAHRHVRVWPEEEL